jgi:hypothetical protein
MKRLIKVIGNYQSMTILVQSSLLIAFILLVGCGEKYEYKKSLRANNYSKYKDFLVKYPNGPYTDSIKFRIETLKFEDTKKLNNLSAYEDYLKEYPKGIFLKEVNDSIDVQKYYLAKSINDITSYESYIKEYPQGIFIKDALDSLEAHRFSYAKSSINVMLLKAYIEEYPLGKFADSAKYVFAENVYEEILKYFGYTEGNTEIRRIAGKDLKGWSFGSGIRMDPGTVRLDMFCNEQIAILIEVFPQNSKVRVLYLANNLVIEYNDGQKLIFNNFDQQKLTQMKQIAGKIKREGFSYVQDIKGMKASSTLIGGGITIQ